MYREKLNHTFTTGKRKRRRSIPPARRPYGWLALAPVIRHLETAPCVCVIRPVPCRGQRANDVQGYDFSAQFSAPCGSLFHRNRYVPGCAGRPEAFGTTFAVVTYHLAGFSPGSLHDTKINNTPTACTEVKEIDVVSFRIYEGSVSC